jgi:putative drug exporter of the RND superfamily
MHGEQLARKAFPKLATNTDVVLVFSREPFLTPADQAVVVTVVKTLQGNLRSGWTVRSIETESALASRFLARDNLGRPVVSLVVASSDDQYDSDAVIADVNRIESLARSVISSASPATLPGLAMEVTGNGGLGRDEDAAEDQAHVRITFASIFAVMIVLLTVYRAPLAASVPLICVAVSACVSTEALQLMRSYGAPITAEELTYLVVIVFGAGTDFALFWLSRFDEELATINANDSCSRPDAARRAYVATVPGIASSAATTILGLCALLVSLFQPNHSMGLAMAFSLFVALVASVTLMPAMALTMGTRLFWPRRKPMSAGESAGRWAWAAGWVTRKPWATVLVLCILTALPLWASFRVNYRVETDAAVLADSSFLRGEAIAEKHFGRGMLFPWTALVKFDSEESMRRYMEQARITEGAPSLTILSPASQQNAILDDLAKGVAIELKGGESTTDVWSFAAPLGQRSMLGSTLASILSPGSLANYWNPAERTLRFEVMATEAPFSPAAIAAFRAAISRVETLLAKQKIAATVLATGPTPLVANLDALTHRDEQRVKIAVVIAVAFVVVLLTRDLMLTIVLMLITLLAYQATMGLTAIVFVHILGYPAINWEIKMFAFVILMAIGQDYNLFLISRLLEERRRRGLRAAIRLSMIRTGGIISSCGLITAVSLGSLVASGQFYLAQMGFALAAGTLMDTFLVRPFLLPALLVLLRRPALATAKGSLLTR